MRITRLIRKTPLDSNTRAIRGLLGKAKRVVQGMKVFLDLAKKQPLGLNLEVLEKGRLVRLLIEACNDNALSEGATSRGLKGWVDEESFEVLDTVPCAAISVFWNRRFTTLWIMRASTASIFRRFRSAAVSIQRDGFSSGW